MIKAITSQRDPKCLGWDTGTLKMQTGWDTGTPKMKTTCVDRQTKIGKPEKEERRKKKSRI